MKNRFIQAIHTKNKICVNFYSKQDKSTLVRTCAPMDYGPSRRTQDKSDRFHMWDYDSDTKRHTLSLKPEQVISIQTLGETFNPEDFITWSTESSPWFVPRDWGRYS